jgi:hypothetical protein
MNDNKKPQIPFCVLFTIYIYFIFIFKIKNILLFDLNNIAGIKNETE